LAILRYPYHQSNQHKNKHEDKHQHERNTTHNCTKTKHNDDYDDTDAPVAILFAGWSPATKFLSGFLFGATDSVRFFTANGNI